MTPVELLKAARARIEDPRHWTKGLNRAPITFPISINPNENEYAYCAYGALIYSIPGIESVDILDEDRRALNEAEEHLRTAVRLGYGETITMFNDSQHTEHAHVLGVYDKAIELAS